ncbi:MAG: hypothetical protein JSU05_06055, partial [Bacteroidetes bacterium]|nr:hypothetical protein [Bacteroidota bacterium]
NGNITGIVWKSDGDDIRRKYDFTYDETYRMLKADFIQQNADDGLWNNSQVNYSVQWGNGSTGASAYDANGNIKAVTRYGYRPGVSASSPIDQLTYNYMYDNSSNRLLNVIDAVNDPATTLGDFRTSLLHTQTKTSTTVDYTYDDNGNMVKDLNKDLVTYNGNKGLTYNYLNLTEKATVKKDGTADKGTITYTYDASGMKLKKIVYETGLTVPYNGSNYTSDVTTETIYIGEFVYETKSYSNGTLNTGLGYTKRLQFIMHEEGRTRLKIVGGVMSLQYDYFIRDHIGNIRMVLTEENSPAAVYEAGMELANRSEEIQLFSQIPETEYDKPGGFDNLPVNENAKVSKLFNSSGSDKRTGPMLVLKVMAGDKFKASVYEWYQPGNTNVATLPGASDIATNIINALLSGLPAGSKYSGTELNSSGVLNAPLGGFLTYQETQNNGSKPKAFLNWMVLDDEQFKLVTGNYGAVQVESITGSDTKKAITAAGGGEIEITRNGYLIVYVSNESQGSVYFDQLHVEHIRGALTEETHYYPAGMQMTGISSQALNDTYRANEYKYQGQEYEGSLGLNMLEFEARMYDPQLGRWHVPDPANQFASPYTGMGNNWAVIVDPDGRFVWMIPVIAAAVFGTGNLTAHAIRGDIHNLWDGLKYFGQGAMAGAAIGMGISAGLGVPVLGTVIKTALISYAATTAVSVVSGEAQGIVHGDWSQLENAGKIFLGNFYLDEHKSFFGGVFEGISRHSWQLIQQVIGNGTAQMYNTFGNVRSVTYYGGTTVSETFTQDWGAITQGSMILGSRGINANPNNVLFQHEYGHYLQSQSSGFWYYGKFGIPSLMSHPIHNFHPAEQDANARAYKYFLKHINGFAGWNFTENPIQDQNYRIRIHWFDLFDLLGIMNSIYLNKKY